MHRKEDPIPKREEPATLNIDWRQARSAAGVGILVGVPLIFWTSLLGPYSVPKLALLVAGIGILLGISLMIGRTDIQLPTLSTIAIPLAALSVPSISAWAFGNFREWSLFGHHDRFLGLLPALLITILGALLIETFFEKPEWIARALSVAAGWVGLYAAAQWLGIDLIEQGRYVGASTLGNPNFAGGFLAIGLPICVIAARQDVQQQRLHIATALSAFAGLVATDSQGAWVAALAGLATLAIGWSTARRQLRVLMVVLAAGLVIASPLVVLIRQARVPDRGDAVVAATSEEQRGWWWDRAVKVWRDHPVTGAGPNVYALENTRYRSAEEAMRFPHSVADDPHSVPLSHLANSGLIGGIGFLSLAAWIGWKAFSVIRLPEDLHWGFAAALVAYLAQSTVSIDEIPIRVALVASIVGVVTLRPVRKPKRRLEAKVTRRPEWWRIALASASALAGIIAGSAMLLADGQVKSALDQAGDDPAAGIELAKSSYGMWPLLRYEEAIGELSLQDDAGSNESKTSTERTLDDLGRFPHPIYRIALGTYMYERGESEIAEGLFEEALRLDPFSPDARIGMARVSLERSDPDTALAFLEPLLDFAYDTRYQNREVHAEFWGVYALTLDNKNDPTGARQAARRALAIDPEQEDAVAVLEATS